MIPNSVSLRKALLEVLEANPVGLKSREIDDLVAIRLKLTVEDLQQIRSGTRTEFAYRMAWERTHAKAKGNILKLAKGYWQIVQQ